MNQPIGLYGSLCTHDLQDLAQSWEPGQRMRAHARTHACARAHAQRRRGRSLQRKVPNPIETVHWLCSISHTPSSPRTTFITSVFSFLRMMRILSGIDPKSGGKGFMSEDLGTKGSSALVSYILSPRFHTLNRREYPPACYREYSSVPSSKAS